MVSTFKGRKILGIPGNQHDWLASVRTLLIAVLLCTATLCHAQYGASVQGTVTDPSGAVIPGVAVTLHSLGTAADLNRVTDSSGYYRFPAVAPGDYTVAATMTAFQTASVSVTVSPDQIRGLDIKLSPTGSNTTVTVKSIATDLNPDETRTQATLSSEEITKLPLASHDVQQLIALTPGVSGYENTNPAGGYGSTLFAATFAPPFQGNGQGTNSNLYLLDDLPISDSTAQGNALIFPNADMIDQVALQSTTYSVENGSSASLQISFSTKSGTNKFHGDLDYTYAGSNIGASRNVFNTVQTDAVTGIPFGTPSTAMSPFHQNEILGSIGGPIWKDHTFAFFSFQRQNAGIGQPSPVNQNIWDPAFEKWALTAFPNSGMAKAVNLAPDTRDVPGPTSKVLYANDPSLGTAATCGTLQTTGTLNYTLPCDTPIYDTGYVFNQAQPFDGTQYFGRLDQSFRHGDRVYAAYERIDQYLGFYGDRPNLDAASPSATKYFSANWVHVFSPTLLNEAHFGNLRGSSGIVLNNPTIAGSTPWPGPAGLDTTAGYAYFQPLGLVPNGPYAVIEHNYNLRDTVSWTHGSHNIRAGYQWTREDYLQNQQEYARGFPFFGIGDTISNIATTESYSGAIYSISGLTGQYQPQVYGATVFFNGAWVDDTWKVRKNMTITAGLRYDSFGNPVPYSTSAKYAGLFPGSGSNFYQQALNTTTRITPTAFTEGQNVNFQPRVGAAYTPTGLHGNVVLHGGVGLYENALTPLQIANNLPTQPPVRVNIGTYGPLDFGDFTTATAPYGHTYNGMLPFPVYGSNPSGAIYSNPQHTQIYQIQLNGFTPNPKPEKYLVYSFGGEQQFPGHAVFGLSYAGSYGFGLLTGAVANGPNGVGNADFNLQPGLTTRPDPNFAQLRYTRDDGIHTNYNALIVTLRQNYKGLSYQSSYTWSKAMQDAPSFNDEGNGTLAFWPGAYDPKVYRGPSSFDVTNAFSLGGSYQVPKLATSNYLVQQAASGWRISTITVAQTGSPFSVANQSGPSYANDNSWTIDGSQGGTPAFPTYRPNRLRQGFSRNQITKTGAFTKTDFTDPLGAGTVGVLSQQGANTFRNPGYFNVNAGVAKTFSFSFFQGETAGLTLRGDFINALNRTNWQGISQEFASNTFGFSSTANNKRFVQLGARFEF